MVPDQADGGVDVTKVKTTYKLATKNPYARGGIEWKRHVKSIEIKLPTTDNGFILHDTLTSRLFDQLTEFHNSPVAIINWQIMEVPDEKTAHK